MAHAHAPAFLSVFKRSSSRRSVCNRYRNNNQRKRMHFQPACLQFVKGSFFWSTTFFKHADCLPHYISQHQHFTTSQLFVTCSRPLSLSLSLVLFSYNKLFAIQFVHRIMYSFSSCPLYSRIVSFCLVKYSILLWGFDSNVRVDGTFPTKHQPMSTSDEPLTVNIECTLQRPIMIAIINELALFLLPS